MAEVVGGESGDLGVRRQRLDATRSYRSISLTAARRTSTQRDRARVRVAVLGAGEDQQVLAVAAHDGGEVVELEEGGEPVRVLLALLQPLDDAELALDEAEGAQREVDEGVLTRVPQASELGGQHGRLLLELGAAPWRVGGQPLSRAPTRSLRSPSRRSARTPRGRRTLPCRALRERTTCGELVVAAR